ncbi:hypothetical protein BLNAU_13302 [Blattamonas nauphoetae]|uniref:Uncharacterized protein n=1 Tax=Blattamonas nauphoetae TaxID=2049346 RepID=A0ABQ9XK00_9EUKA|nr:hypothetical protein BLNAU_13302 [Blattamonas nauphoetae]
MERGQHLIDSCHIKQIQEREQAQKKQQRQIKMKNEWKKATQRNEGEPQRRHHPPSSDGGCEMRNRPKTKEANTIIQTKNHKTVLESIVKSRVSSGVAFIVWGCRVVLVLHRSE